MNRGQKKRLALNSVSSIALQIITVACSFVLPRLILSNYGTEINGLVNSITHFLSIISFLELGVGAVVKSALYKPLALKDDEEISKIMASGSKFFRKLAMILLAYIVILIVAYPFFIDNKYDFVFTGTLILAMGINSFAQYYFGVLDRLLVTADQRGYIYNNIQCITLIVNTVACVIVIRLGASIQITKLTTSLIFIARPLFLRWYVNRKYRVNRKITYEGEPIKQKWNGVAQHIAAVVLDGTDTVVLTLLSTLTNVSIYTVYHMVVNGVRTLFESLSSGVQSLFGELWAKQELDKLQSTFGWTEWLIHTGVAFAYGCTIMLIVPFIQVYTSGVNDANYTVPAFAVLITLAYASLCIRLPYLMMILAGGHYKQTQNNYILAAALNIVVSVLTVKIWGLIGVAIGTLMAMVYQTVWMAIYDSKHFLQRPISYFVKQCLVDGLSFLILFAEGRLLRSYFLMNELSYLTWIALAIKTACICGINVILVNIVFYREYLSKAMKGILNMLNRRLRGGV